MSRLLRPGARPLHGAHTPMRRCARRHLQPRRHVAQPGRADRRPYRWRSHTSRLGLVPRSANLSIPPRRQTPRQPNNRSAILLVQPRKALPVSLMESWSTAAPRCQAVWRRRQAVKRRCLICSAPLKGLRHRRSDRPTCPPSQSEQRGARCGGCRWTASPRGGPKPVPRARQRPPRPSERP